MGKKKSIEKNNSAVTENEINETIVKIKNNHITGKQLLNLDEHKLVNMGIISVGIQEALLEEINKLKNDN